MFYRYLTVAERRHLLKTVRSCALPEAQRDAAVMDVLQLSGMRVGELVSMTVEDVQRALRTDLLLIEGRARKGGKTGRKVPDFERHLTAGLREALAKLLAARVALAGPGAEDEPAVVSRFGPTAKGGLSVRAVQQRFKFWAKTAGLDERLSPHWMRHSRAKDLMRATESRDPLGVVQHALGHASRASTAIYAGPDKEAVAQANDAADKLALGSMSRRAARRVHRAAVGA